MSKNNFQKSKDFDALVQSVTDYVIAINKDFQVIMANNLFKKEFDISPGDKCYKIWKKRDEKCENCPVEKSFADGKVHQSEETVLMKNGKEALMQVRSTPVISDDGNISYVLETATDITEKKYLEEKFNNKTVLHNSLVDRLDEIQKSEEKYRTIFERSLDAIMLTDPKGKIVEINQAGIKLLKKSKEDLLYLESATSLFENDEDLVRFNEKISQNGFVTDFEMRVIIDDVSSIDVLVTSSVIPDSNGHNSGLVFIIRDITKSKHSQIQIEKQNIRLQTLNAVSTKVSSSLDLDEVLNSTIDKIIEILGSDSVRIYLLDEKKEFLNLTAQKGLSKKFTNKTYMKHRKVEDGLLGQTVFTGETMVVDNILQSEDPYVDAFIEEGLQSTVYIPLISKENNLGVMCVSSHSEFVFSKDYVDFLSAIGNQIGMAVDNANLYENVKSAYEKLKNAQEQIIRVEKLSSLGKLAATIAHEINNPLAAVLTYIRLMIKLIKKKRFSEDRIEDISRYLDTMESETARCGEIVKNLLAFSRQSKISIGIHDIMDIINKSLTLIYHDLEIRGIRLEQNIQPDLPMVSCDFRQIQQALLNLLSNASESMNAGGVMTISSRHLKNENLLEVVISDTGSGIAEKDKKNIFEPFFTTKEEGKGVGLGLSVVYGIITKHNGSIELETEIGKGSSFYVRLPVA
ncbi:MAG: PAS domain S-box protein [Desulfobacterales bacterium]|nr:PAS domain S-box protein [Desulfobacteraceae bacterium]MBT7085584.1 PAS domain S-box protein [Desulfobacterales bacterium]MBT7696580.1 PAS domain S-box protein [Desulfobacterales bacterium]